ncbi:hypothetical protein SteCoe_22092 [Stentor coeruleus]|uniref:Uncharacterized protein n=1 Tax=Stentor coeruleus TaxID=5963 RepID=A0A1R2BN18_9CILI|nr:hypothetical protein SteCoe_22092 [Stentor coeruleus]
MDQSASESFALASSQTLSASQVQSTENKLSYENLISLQVSSLRGGELKGHSSPIIFVALSSLNNLIASCDASNKIKLWDLINRKNISTIVEHSLPVGIFFLQNGSNLLVALKSGMINDWNTLTGSLESTSQSQFKLITAAAIIDGGSTLALAGENKIQIVKTKSLEIECEFLGQNEKINCLSFIQNSYLLVSGESDSILRIWNFAERCEVSQLEGHEAEINCITVSPNGSLMMSFSNDSTMILWDLSTKIQIFKSSTSNFFINSMVFSEDSEKIIMACNEHSVKIWDVSNKCIDHVIHQGQGSVKAIAITPSSETIVAGYDDSKVRILNTQDKRCEKTIYLGDFELNCADMSRDYKYLACGAKDGNLVIWNMVQNELHKKVHFYEGYFNSMDLTADDKILVAGGGNGEVNIYNIEKKKLIYSIQAHSAAVWAVAITTNQKYIISGGEDNVAKLWKLSDKTEKGVFVGHYDCINAVDSTNDSKYVITGSEDNSVKVWNLKSKEEVFSLDCESKVLCLKWYEPKKWIISGSRDYLIRIWDFNTQSLHIMFKGHTSTVRSFFISANKQYLLSCGYDSMIYVWNLEEEKEMFSIDSNSGWLRAVTMTSDNKYIITSGSSGVLKIWTFEEQNIVVNTKVNCDSTRFLMLTKDDKYLIATGTEGYIRIIDLASKQEYSVLHQMPNQINTLKINSKFNLIAAGHENSSVCIYYIKTKKKRTILLGHTDKVNCLKLMCSDKFIISGSSDNTIKVWNIMARTCESTFAGHTGSVVSLAVSNDNSIIASGSADFSIKIWNFSKRTLELTLPSHANIILSLVFGNNGKYLYSGCSDKSIIAWNITEKKEEFKLQGQHGNVASITLSDDEKHIISGNYKSIVVWNIKSRKEEFELPGHLGLINYVAITHDLKTIYSASQDCSAKKWNLIPKRMRNTVQRKKSTVYSFASNPDWAHFYTVTNDGFFNVFSSKTFKLENKYSLSKKKILTVYVSDDENMAVCGCQNGSTFIFHLGEHITYFKFNKQSKSINNVSLSHDKTKVIIIAENKVISLWDIKSKKLEKEFIGHKAKVTHTIFLKNKNYLISSSEDWRVKVWNIETEKDEHTFICEEVANCISVNLEESLLAVGIIHSYIRIWDLTSMSDSFLLRGHNDSVNSLVFSKKHKTLLSGSSDYSVILWDLEKQEIIRQISFNIAGIFCIGFVTENLVMTTSNDNTVKIFDTNTGKQFITPQNFSGNITGLTTLYYNNLLISCSDMKTLNFYDIGKSMDCDTFFTSFIGMCICPSKDEKCLYIGTKDGDIYEFNIESQRNEISIKGHSSWISDLCITEGFDTPGTSWLVSASEDKTIKVWNMESKALEFTLSGHTRCVNEVAVVNKRSCIVSCSSDKTVRLWDIKDRKELFIFTGHTAAVLTIATTSDENYAISGSEDCSVRIWNLQTLRLDIIFTEHTGSVTSIVSCRNSEFIVSGDVDGNVIIWNLHEKRHEYKMPTFPMPIKKLALTPSNDQLIIAYEDKICIVPTKLISDNKSLMKKKFSTEDGNFDIEFSDGSLSSIKSSTDNYEKNVIWEPYNNFDSVAQDLVAFYSVIDALKSKTYSCSEHAAEITFTKSKYTLAHIFAFTGQTAYLKSIMNNKFVLKTDIFGHSPVYYGIIKKSQTCVDAILDYLVADERKSDNSLYESSIYALRNDFCLIISNSSCILHLFLQNLLVTSKTVFMKTSEKLPLFRFDSHHIPVYKDFLTDVGQENLVRLQYIPFSLPYILGSNESIEFSEAIVDCENNAIFSTPVIQHFIQYQWDSLYYWVAGNSMLLFLNLLFLILVICLGNNITELIIVFLCINVLLFLWEFIQFFSSGLSYFCDVWNLLDVCRLIATFTYIIIQFFEDDYPYLSWIMVILNFVRGLTAFRMFDGTRFYVNLILRSIKAMLNFFIMFTYSTFTLSLLLIISREQKTIDFNNLWMDSYALNFGGYDASSVNYPTLESIVFIVGTLVNVVLMLNLLISILGDSYSEFQEEKYEVDYRLKAELTLEIQGMFFWVGSSNEKKVFQVLSSPNEEENAESIDAKIKMLKHTFEKNLHSLNSGQDDISDKVRNSSKVMTDKIDGIENRVSSLEEKMDLMHGDIQEILKCLKGKN